MTTARSSGIPGRNSGAETALPAGQERVPPVLPSGIPAGIPTGAGRRPVVWWAVLAVALCGVVATAHGLYSVARACGVGTRVAYLYVPITDGLALVAYASTARLVDGGRRYAWLVVVAAAGLSGLAQAVNLAGLGAPSWGLRFGVGYWPAVAVAVAAHLLWLVGERPVSRVREPLVEPAHDGPDERPDEWLGEWRQMVLDRAAAPAREQATEQGSEGDTEQPVGQATEQGTEQQTEQDNVRQLSSRPKRRVSSADSQRRRRQVTAKVVSCDPDCPAKDRRGVVCGGREIPVSTRNAHRRARRA